MERESGPAPEEMAGKLFSKHADWRYNARLNPDEPIPGPDGIMLGSSGPNSFSMYAEGYKKLADAGVAHIAEAHWDVDLLVYPILFCYRHYLELRLKEFVLTGGDLVDQKLAFPTNHILPQIWRAVRPLLEKIWPGAETKGQLDAIEDVVNQLSEIDPKSTAFRYPLDKDENRSLPGLRHINVRQVSEVINGIAPTLDGASCGIDEDLDAKREMLAEAHKDAMYYAEPPDY